VHKIAFLHLGHVAFLKGRLEQDDHSEPANLLDDDWRRPVAVIPYAISTIGEMRAGRTIIRNGVYLQRII
jgi:hypothetical protein